MAEVREARPEEYPLLPALEAAADTLFGVHGITVPTGPKALTTMEQLEEAAANLVVDDPPRGCARLVNVDGLAHLEQLSVHPTVMRQGLGTALLLGAVAWAAERGYPAITLTTFRDLPFNGPFYARQGFVELTELTPGLAAAREHERDMGLDRQSVRIAMRRDLHRSAPTSAGGPAGR
jgi:GNAT superfamily N-acetyltransferase